MTRYRKSYEVTGYTTEDGGILCIDCTEQTGSCIKTMELVRESNDLLPIFLDSEWDYQPTCDHCFSKIDCSVLRPE